MVIAALGTVLIVVCSWISIPTVVPFTLQTFAIFLILDLLGAEIGLASIGVYLLLGSVGLPVFAGFSGGIGCLFGPTGGFLVGFIIMGIVYLIFQKYQKRPILNILTLIIGLVACYTFGIYWFILVYSGGEVTFSTALNLCVLPFIIPDLLKLAFALVVSKRLKKSIMPYL